MLAMFAVHGGPAPTIILGAALLAVVVVRSMRRTGLPVWSFAGAAAALIATAGSAERSATFRPVPRLLPVEDCGAVLPDAGPALDDGTAMPRSNLVLVTVDTLRWDRLGVYGYDRPTSPAIDEFASSSIVFERAYSAAPWTVPALGSILTGSHPQTHGAGLAHRVPQRLRTIATALRSSSYATGAFVGTVIPLEKFGFRDGFDDFSNNPEDTERILSWVENLGDDPYFLWVHYVDPHAPYEPADENLESVQSEWTARDLAGFEFNPTSRDSCPSLAPEQVRMANALYDGEVRQVDARIRDLFEGLRRIGRWEDTVVAVTADHGEEIYDHGKCGHAHTLYDELIRVPLVVRIPDREGRIISDAVSLVDLAPTLLSAVGGDPSGFADGRSLLSRIDAGKPIRDPVLADNQSQTARIEGYDKLIATETGHRRFRLNSRS